MPKKLSTKPTEKTQPTKSSTQQRWQVVAAEVDTRLDKYLAAAERLGSRSRAFAALERGKIYVDDIEQRAANSGRRLRAGETILYWEDRPGSSKPRVTPSTHVTGFKITYEDEVLLVVNKPAGLLTIPRPAHPSEPCLFEHVRHYLERQRKRAPFIVHRIDRDTTGLVVVAKTERAQDALKEQFLAREPARIYLAVVHGCPEPASGNWQDVLAWDRASMLQRVSDEDDEFARDAECNYRTVEKFRGAALIEVRLVTGKRNQIRVQAGVRGHPLVGEKKYTYNHKPAVDIPFGRQALHAYQLEFRHPTDNRALTFEAPLPQDFDLLLKRLRLERGRPARSGDRTERT
ncbi:MAG: RluA family pseudouridine synthase [Planctomycetota bacterium]